MPTTYEQYEQLTFPGLTSGAQVSHVKTYPCAESGSDLEENAQVCFSQLQALLRARPGLLHYLIFNRPR